MKGRGKGVSTTSAPKEEKVVYVERKLNGSFKDFCWYLFCDSVLMTQESLGQLRKPRRGKRVEDCLLKEFEDRNLVQR